MGADAFPRYGDEVTGLDTSYVLEKGPSAGLGDERRELGHGLFVGLAGNLGMRMQPFRHAGESEEALAAMIVQWPLTSEVARQQKPLGPPVPPGEREIPDQPLDCCLAPLLETGEQNVGVAKRGGVAPRQTECRGEFRAIVEADIGDQRPMAVGAMQRLAIEKIFRKGAEQTPAERDRTFGPLPSIVRSVDLLSCKYAVAPLGDAGLPVEMPKAGQG